MDLVRKGQNILLSTHNPPMMIMKRTLKMNNTFRHHTVCQCTLNHFSPLLSWSVVRFCFFPLLLLHLVDYLLEESCWGSLSRTGRLWGLHSTWKDPRMICSTLNYTLSCLQVSMLPLVHWERKVTRLDGLKPYYSIFICCLFSLEGAIIFDFSCVLTVSMDTF